MGELGWDVGGLGWNVGRLGWDVGELGWDVGGLGWDVGGLGWDVVGLGWDGDGMWVDRDGGAGGGWEQLLFLFFRCKFSSFVKSLKEINSCSFLESFFICASPA